ncbi:hypothetical protein MSMAS_0535 [Methanosarcina mazei S-6]|uniref:Uncharacterized protein n=2 Tax=Methanosarcina mazei TaxID=2209 RepID=A0A0E3LTL5_METMZ|nr:hypothetical protein MSMAS_0535 [Methanosarcina mazei S-6]AKB67082.1 hypothetical protein MSMAL_0539 [Methanosarcina mazei LYC]
MQKKSTFNGIIFQSRTSDFPINILLIISRNIESRFNSSINSSNAHSPVLQVIGNYPLIISNGREWFGYWKEFKFNSFKSLTRDVSCTLNKRRREFWILFSDVFIGSVMDRYLAVGFVFKAIFSDFVKHSVKKSNGFFEVFFIFLRNTEFKFNRSIHIHVLMPIDYILEGSVKAGS